MRALLPLVLVVLVLAACGSSPAPRPRAEPGMYRVGKLSLHLDCHGTGSPVVLLLAGGRDTTDDWTELVRRLGPDVHTCAFDYPGVGPSSAASGQMTPRIVADTLHDTLAAADVPAPYVVVGHSLAGLSTRVFVGEHPDDVAGVVLFDGTPVEIVEADPAELERELDWDPAATIRQARAVSAWPDVPVRILQRDFSVRTDGTPADEERRWHRGQVALSKLSPQGRFEMVPRAGHFIYQDRPDVAVAAITDVLERG